MASNFDVSLLHLGKVTYESECGVYLHTHKDFYQLQFLTEGEAVLRVEEKGIINEYTIDCNHIALIKPGVLHGMKKDEFEKQSLPYIDMKLSVSDALLESQLNKLPSTLKIDKSISDIIIRITKIKNNQILSDAITTALIYELISLSPETSTLYSPDVSTASYKAYTYINENCKKNISLDDVCNAVSYNKTYLSAVFKKDFNITVNEYITIKRVEKAKELLLYSEYGITGIAHELNFASVAHFSRVFKESVGISPSDYRKNNT